MQSIQTGCYDISVIITFILALSLLSLLFHLVFLQIRFDMPQFMMDQQRQSCSPSNSSMMDACICKQMDTCLTPKPKQWIRDKNSNVVVIGAGPAGIHMASLLSKAGYQNVQILEKTNRIGGKSWTINSKTSNSPQEMGTCFTSNVGGFFDEIYKLFDEYDPENKMIDLPNADKLVIKENGDLEQFDDYLYKKIEDKAVHEWLHFFPAKLTSAIPFIVAAKRYCKTHEEIFDEYDFSALPKPKTKEQLKLIDMSLLKFLNKNELDAMIPMFLFLYTMFGYGALDYIPAYYGLWWFKPKQVRAIIELKNIIDKKPTSRITSKGFQSLWTSISHKCNLNIKYNVSVIKIDRKLDTKDGKINIKYSVDDDGDHECQCDVLFVACDAKDSLKFLDATDEESKIFGSINHCTLSTALIEFKSNPKIVNEYKADNLLPGNISAANGNIMEFRMTQKVLKFKENYDYKTDTNAAVVDTAIVKQFSNAESNDGTLKSFQEKMYSNLKDVIGIGLDSVKEIEPIKIWQYFPHYSSESIQKGYPWIVRDEMQGKYNNTYYIGSSVCFESTKDVVEYNIQLKQRIGF
eukprot:103503_1